jgi:succinyl-CoA synthetase beta subunit
MHSTYWARKLRSLSASVSRGYNLHEYQGIDQLRKYGLPTPAGKVAESAVEAGQVAKSLGVPEVVLKA